MLTKITVQKNKDRMKRDCTFPLTRITLLCGPNGSGKSTCLDAARDLVNKHPLDNMGREWTRETAPAIIEGEAKGIMTFSFERDNPRMLQGSNHDAREVVMMMLSRERSHGQSNFDKLQGAFENPSIDVMILDEPESALDLDGILWLRAQLLATDKQVVIATHNMAILSLIGQHDDVSMQIFGEEDGYYERLKASYLALCSDKKVPKPKKRLALPKFPVAKRKAKWGPKKESLMDRLRRD